MAGGKFLGRTDIDQMGRAPVGLGLPAGERRMIDTADLKARLDLGRAPPRRFGGRGADRAQAVAETAFQIEPGEPPALGPTGQ